MNKSRSSSTESINSCNEVNEYRSEYSDGDREFENVKWRKPVAMLVNAGTRSGKEVLAYGFKKHKLGEVIGTRTEGAVLAATASSSAAAFCCLRSRTC
jgi:C-terminal processing protease CtpA/Prc